MFTDPKYVFTMGVPIFNSYSEHAEYAINRIKDKYLGTLAGIENKNLFLEDVYEWNKVLNETWKKNNLEIVGIFNLADYSINLYWRKINYEQSYA